MHGSIILTCGVSAVYFDVVVTVMSWFISKKG
jgi:hypothetical protein